MDFRTQFKYKIVCLISAGDRPLTSIAFDFVSDDCSHFDVRIDVFFIIDFKVFLQVIVLLTEKFDYLLFFDIRIDAKDTNQRIFPFRFDDLNVFAVYLCQMFDILQVLFGTTLDHN
jgi:hypothetical protein